MKMMTTKTLLSKASLALAGLGATLATQAVLAGDLVGGPAKNQLDLHPPVTKLASDIQGLHYFMLIICLVISMK